MTRRVAAWPVRAAWPVLVAWPVLAAWPMLAAVSVVLLLAVGGAGDSAATPGLGPGAGTPPWDLAAALGRTATDGSAPLASPWLVSAALVLAYLCGAGAVWLGLRATRDRPALAGPAPRRLLLAGGVAALLLTLVPPVGSADHLSYVAYGRITAAGGDSYAVAPVDWRGGTDPVAGAVQPPWQHTPNVYGPVATQAFSLAARLGGGSLRLTVWWWQLCCALAFVAAGLLLDRAARGDPRARLRAAVLWTANPVLLGQLVLGAHVDVLAAGFAVAALVVLRPGSAAPGLPATPRAPLPAAARALLAGVLVGAAAGTKAPYALAGVAALWALPGPVARPAWWRSVGLGLLGAVAVLVPGYLWAGPHAFDQSRVAAGFTSIASPWRAVANLAGPVVGTGVVRAVLVPVAVLLAGWLAVRIGRRTADPALALTAAWVLLAPYALPWYDALVWAPLALCVAAVPQLEALLLARLTVLALAYLPGRVVGLTPSLEAVSLGFRRYVAPVLVLAAVAATLRWSRPTPPAPPPAG